MSYFMFGYFKVYIVIFPEYREPAKVYPVKNEELSRVENPLPVGGFLFRPHGIWKVSEQTFDMT